MSGNAAELLRRSTVQVRTPRGSAGSGVVVAARSGSTVLTNAHVVGSSSQVQVQLWDGRTLAGKVAHRHNHRDLALIRLAGDLRTEPAAFASTSTLRPGAFVMAIGNPLGFTGALSTGVVHAVGGEWVQATVRLAPGNSGGPLANANGQVVGINTMAAANGSLGLAIPSEVALGFLQRPQGMRLGVTVAASPSGLVITSLEPDGPAARASLLVGDLLVNHRSFEELRRAIDRSGGAPVHLEFQRAGKPQRRSVRVAPVEAAAP